MVYAFEVRWLAVRTPGFPKEARTERALELSRRDTGAAVVYSLGVPGFRRRDLAIEVCGRVVTVRGESSRGWLGQSSHRAFTKSFALPPTVDDQDIEAELRDDVLILTVAKTPSARARQIPVLVSGRKREQDQEPASAAAPEQTWWSRLSAWLAGPFRRARAATR